jgi:hypothetical protein
MHKFRAPLIAALTMISWAAFGQQSGIRVITPDSEHVYSADPARPQQLPDDEALKLQNERAERAKVLRQMQREDARRQDVTDAEFERLRVERDQAPANAWDAREKARMRANGGPLGGGQDRRAFGR